MCNLNLYIKSEKTEDSLKDLLGFLTCVTSKSFIFNKDSDGVYFSNNNKVIKSNSKINFFRYLKEIKDSNFILSHQRFKTSGNNSLKYSHPFKSKEFILLHNGILSDFNNNIDSDTYLFFKQFVNHFNSKENQINTNRELKIIECIKVLLNKIEGSYSIALFDIKTKNLYYFKNDYTQISFYKSTNDKNLFITTNMNNGDYLDIYNNNIFEEFKIKNFRIYKIEIKRKKIKINVVGKLKRPFKIEIEKTPHLTLNQLDSAGYLNGFEDIKGNKNKGINDLLEDDFKTYNLYTDYYALENSNNYGYCEECHIKTKNINKKNSIFICKDCLKFNKLYEKTKSIK